MDRQIYARTTPGQTGKYVFSLTFLYQAAKVEMRTRERALLYERGQLAVVMLTLDFSLFEAKWRPSWTVNGIR